MMGSDSLIKKTLIHAGKQYVKLTDGSKVFFHFQTWRLGSERILIDDSRKIGKKQPMELILGSKFKLEAWEAIVKMMAVGEVASFEVDKSLVFSYPFVSKTLRDLSKEQGAKRHMCTMMLQTEGIGYKDLDELIAQPHDLEFIIELLSVDLAGEYKKDLWQLNDDEKFVNITQSKEKGNKYYVEKKYKEACKEYERAIAICEQLLNREKPHDIEWTDLQNIKMPILLNYAQCKLIDKEYYEVIEHCNTVLQFLPGFRSITTYGYLSLCLHYGITLFTTLMSYMFQALHVSNSEKALYRRAQAHKNVWSPDQAEADFKRVKELHPSMSAAIQRELIEIQQMRKDKEAQDRAVLRNMFNKK